LTFWKAKEWWSLEEKLLRKVESVIVLSAKVRILLNIAKENAMLYAWIVDLSSPLEWLSVGPKEKLMLIYVSKTIQCMFAWSD
jgi:hypothetical protein